MQKMISGKCLPAFPSLFSSLLKLIVGGVFFWAMGATAAASGYTPGMYADVDAAGKQYHDLQFRTRVDFDSGPNANVFYANQFSASGGTGGYVGTQTIRDAQGRHQWLFSVWGATACEPNTAMPGAICYGNTDGAPGYSVRVWYKWIVGHIYSQRLVKASGRPGWWQAWVTDTSTGDTFNIGTLKFGDGDYVTPGTMFLEYWDWGNPNATCMTQPYTRVTRYPVRGDAGPSPLLNPRVGNVPGPCDTGSHADLNPDGSVRMEGNPYATARTSIRLKSGGMCIGLLHDDPTPTNLVISENCRGDASHQFVWAAKGQIVVGQRCVSPSADDVAAITYPCYENSPRQKWSNVPGTAYLQNDANGLCLTHVPSHGGSQSGAWLALAACGSDPANQSWGIRDRQ